MNRREFFKRSAMVAALPVALLTADKQMTEDKLIINQDVEINGSVRITPQPGKPAALVIDMSNDMVNLSNPYTSANINNYTYYSSVYDVQS